MPGKRARPVRREAARKRTHIWAPRRAAHPTEFGKDCFGLDQSQARLYTAIARHTVLVCAALAVCAVTAALLRDRINSQAPEPVHPDQPPPTDPGLIPLTIPEIKHLTADTNTPTTRTHNPLGELTPPAPSTITMVPQTHQTRPQHQDHPGQLANGGCRTSSMRRSRRRFARARSSSSSSPPTRARNSGSEV
jgi:hypothetical protein